MNEQFLQRKAAHVNTPKRNLVVSTVLGLLVVVAVLALAGVSVAGNGKGKGKGHHVKGHAKAAKAAKPAKSASSAEYEYGSGGHQYKDHKVLICHNGHTISVDQHAVKAHVGHHTGDTLGAC